MPCTACGKGGGLNVSSKKPSAMVFGRNRGVRKNFVQRPRNSLVLNVSKPKTFLLGKR